MKKRGMSQVFYYIFAAILISFIFFFGYQQITKLQNLNEQAKFIQFKTDFQDAVSNVYYKNPGSIISYAAGSANKPLILPRDNKKICFEKLNDKSRVKGDSKYFASFIVDKLIPEQGNLKLENNNYCANLVNSQFSFTLENKIANRENLVYIR